MAHQGNDRNVLQYVCRRCALGCALRCALQFGVSCNLGGADRRAISRSGALCADRAWASGKLLYGGLPSSTFLPNRHGMRKRCQEIEDTSNALLSDCNYAPRFLTSF